VRDSTACAGVEKNLTQMDGFGTDLSFLLYAVKRSVCSVGCRIGRFVVLCMDVYCADVLVWTYTVQMCLYGRILCRCACMDVYCADVLVWTHTVQMCLYGRILCRYVYEFVCWQRLESMLEDVDVCFFCLSTVYLYPGMCLQVLLMLRTLYVCTCVYMYVFQDRHT
jgi:hypothetical protein